MKRYFLFVAVFAALALPAHAEDLDQIFKKVNEYVAAKNYPKAIEELGWAQKEIEKMNGEQLKSYFPEEIIGYKGQPFKVNSAMGLTNLERTYQNAAGQVKVSITGTGQAGAMGGIAAIGRMAAMMGNQPGMDSFRIDGLTATLKESSHRAELSVFLDSGSILKLESNKKEIAGDLRKIAEGLKVGEIDKYLKGAAG